MEISIAACRVNAKMTQTEFAEAIGVSLPTITNWEKGKTEPRIGHLRKISEISGIPIDDIAVGGSLSMNCNS